MIYLRLWGDDKGIPNSVWLNKNIQKCVDAWDENGVVRELELLATAYHPNDGWTHRPREILRRMRHKAKVQAIVGGRCAFP